MPRFAVTATLVDRQTGEFIGRKVVKGEAPDHSCFLSDVCMAHSTVDVKVTVGPISTLPFFKPPKVKQPRTALEFLKQSR